MTPFGDNTNIKHIIWLVADGDNQNVIYIHYQKIINIEVDHTKVQIIEELSLVICYTTCTNATCHNQAEVLQLYQFTVMTLLKLCAILGKEMKCLKLIHVVL